MPKVKCTISEVIPFKKHKQNPIVAHYQNGELSDEFAKSLDACIATDTQNGANRKVLLTVSNNNVYDGYIDDGYSSDLKRSFIGIRDKRSNEMKLVEVHNCNMLSYYYNNLGKPQEEDNTAFNNLNLESARRILFKDFGGKKAMRVLDRKEKMKVNVDVVKEQLDKTLLEFTTSTAEGEDEFDKVKLEQDQLLAEMMPRMNKEATKLVEVYKLSELIEANVLASLNDEALRVLKSTRDDMPIKRKFLVSIIESIQRSKTPDDPDNMLKVKACIYIDALINYFKLVNSTRVNVAVKLHTLSEFTDKLDAHIRKKFSQPHINRVTKTNYVVHKTACFIIVLSLLVSDRYEMDIQHIIEEVGISKTNLVKMLNNTAVRQKSNSSIMGIRLPSQLRMLSTNFRKRRTL